MTRCPSFGERSLKHKVCILGSLLGDAQGTFVVMLSENGLVLRVGPVGRTGPSLGAVESEFGSGVLGTILH